MLYDHQNDINALKLEKEAAKIEALQSCDFQLEALKADKSALKEQLKQQVTHAYG